MSFKIMATAMAKRFEGASQKALMMALADTADDDGGGIWRSVASLARLACISKRHTNSLLLEWRASGLIHKTGEQRCATGYTAVYAINVALLQSLPDANPQRSPRAKAKRGEVSSPVQPVHPRGAISSPPGVQPVHPTLSLEPTHEPTLSMRTPISLRESREAGAEVLSPNTQITPSLLSVGIAAELTEAQAATAWQKFCAHRSGQTLAASEIEKAWRVWCISEAAHPTVKYAGKKITTDTKPSARARALVIEGGTDPAEVDDLFVEFANDALAATGARALSRNWQASFVAFCERKRRAKAEREQWREERFG